VASKLKETLTMAAQVVELLALAKAPTSEGYGYFCGGVGS